MIVDYTVDQPNLPVASISINKNDRQTWLIHGVGGAVVDPPTKKMNTFFLRSLALSVPIYRIVQLNEANWRSCKFAKANFT